MLVPLPIGNAVKVLIDPPANSISWVVVRSTGIPPTDMADPTAVIAYMGNETWFIDTDGLNNDTAYWYVAYFYDGTVYTPTVAVSVIPKAAYEDESTDVLTVVRDRIEAGLRNEILRKALTPADGIIDVLNAPPMFEDTRWPVVTVHVVSDGSAERALGEAFLADTFDPIAAAWDEESGWLARAQITVIGWSKNPDERIALRKVLRRLVIGNLPVFESVGMLQVDFNQSDVDELSAYPVPVYESVGTFTCLAPAVIRTEVNDLVNDITSSLTPFYPDPSASIAAQALEEIHAH